MTRLAYLSLDCHMHSMWWDLEMCSPGRAGLRMLQQISSQHGPVQHIPLPKGACTGELKICKHGHMHVDSKSVTASS